MLWRANCAISVSTISDMSLHHCWPEYFCMARFNLYVILDNTLYQIFEKHPRGGGLGTYVGATRPALAPPSIRCCCRGCRACRALSGVGTVGAVGAVGAVLDSARAWCLSGNISFAVGGCRATVGAVGCRGCRDCRAAVGIMSGASVGVSGQGSVFCLPHSGGSRGWELSRGSGGGSLRGSRDGWARGFFPRPMHFGALWCGRRRRPLTIEYPP